MNTAARVRMNKEKHPENYCPVAGCLWRTRSFLGNQGSMYIVKPCGKHGIPARDQEVR